MHRFFPAPLQRWFTLWLCLIGGPCTGFAAEVTRLSMIKDSDFPQWLIGAEWEFSPEKGRTRKFWFAAKDVLIYGRPEEKGGKVASAYPTVIMKKGVVRSFFDREGTRTMELTLADDTTQGTVKDSETGKSFPAKYIGRRSLPPAPKKTEEQFAQWLNGKHLVSGGETSLAFNADGTVLTGGKTPLRFKYQVLRPGLVKFLHNENKFDPTLLAFSPDLTAVRSYVWWGGGEYTVSIGPPPPAAAAAKTPAKKSAPVSMPDMKEIPLAGRAAAVNALLVQELGNSRFAGKASKLSLSALPLEGEKPATVGFNQAVGPMMDKALREVARFVAIRHGGWPRAHEVQLSFEDKYIPKDGPSAAVACALLLESAIKGVALDPEFAVTGDMNADGSVQPIGGVHAKLRGATNLKCRLLGIPSKNAVHATDLVLTEGLKPFMGIQVFSLSAFDEALAVARTDKTPELTAAIKDFAVLARTCGPAPQSLRTPDAVGKLRSILQRAPGHLSAQVLLQYATDKLPKSLSPAGSLSELDQAIGDLNTAIGGDLAATNKLDSGQISRARIGLQRLRPLADARVRPLVDAWVNWGTVAERLVSNKDSINAKSLQEWRAAGSRIKVEDEKLRSNEGFREDLE